MPADGTAFSRRPAGHPVPAAPTEVAAEWPFDEVPRVFKDVFVPDNLEFGGSTRREVQREASDQFGFD